MPRRVFQTTFGGPDAPLEEQGNCMQAAVATLLGITLDESFDSNEAHAAMVDGAEHWYIAFVEWCRERGYGVEITDDAIPGCLGLVDVLSSVLVDADGVPLGHQVVARGNEIVHDPNPAASSQRVYEYGALGASHMYLIPFDANPTAGPLSSLPNRPIVEHYPRGGTNG